MTGWGRKIAGIAVIADIARDRKKQNLTTDTRINTDPQQPWG
jgi:hypothetical protein